MGRNKKYVKRAPIENVYKYHQYRNFDFELYPDCNYHIDYSEAINCWQLLEFLMNAKDLDLYAFCRHFKDTDENEMPLKPHVQCFFRFESPRTIQSMSNHYGIPLTNFSVFWDDKNTGKAVEPKTEERLRYVNHSDEYSISKGKYHYPITDVVTNLDLSVYFADLPDKRKLRHDLFEFGRTHSRYDTRLYAEQHNLENLLSRHVAEIDFERQEYFRGLNMLTSDVKKMIDFTVKQTVIDYQQLAIDCAKDTAENICSSLLFNYDTAQIRFDEQGNAIGVW